MKKNFLSIAVVAAVVALSSCGSKSSGSLDKDVRKLADMRCKMQQLAAKDQADEKVQKDIADLRKEMDEYRDEMEKKYGDKKNDKEMNEKADKIMEEVMSKCK